MRTVQQQRSDVEQYLDSGFLDLDGLLDALELVVEPSSSLFGKPGLRLRKCPVEGRKVAIAISGGGAAGAYNAGLLEVLLARMRQRRHRAGPAGRDVLRRTQRLRRLP